MSWAGVNAGIAQRRALPGEVERGVAGRGAFGDQQIARAGRVERAIGAARGVAVVMARPFSVTLERMAAWLPMLESRGIEIVPVTALADKQANR